uniref:Terpene synthase metal-binding domain-containing protein n=1 Tax=Kalanchoe fedtschenkoi TaxID=63787 RepID=A0A7N0VDF5_KALFE
MGVVYISVLDDTYDAYGTADELELITESINRFDTSLFEQMPPYAREICQMVFGVYSVMEEDLLKDGNAARLPCVKEAMKLIVRSYHNEYLWLKKNLIPTIDEYTQQSFSSSAITTLLIFSLAAMGDIVTKAALDWILSAPKFVIAAQGIGRFLDDIVSHEFEQQRQHIPSAVVS